MGDCRSKIKRRVMMTREELEREAYIYTQEKMVHYSADQNEVIEMLAEFAENDFENMKAGLESQIATLGERCNQLLKDKGDLTDELQACKYAMTMSEKVEKQLREQIEKMKCCSNCNGIDVIGMRAKKCKICIRSKDLSQWEIKEND